MNYKNKIKDYMKRNNIDLEKIVNENTCYIAKVIQNASNNLLSQEDIEEIILDTFFALWCNRDKLECDRLLLPYLVGTAKNICNKKYRKIEFKFNIENYENILFDDCSLDEIIEFREKNKIIYEKLNEFNLKDKQIFELYYYYNKPTKEIATIMKTKDLNIRSRLHRIKKKIKKELEVKGYEE